MAERPSTQHGFFRVAAACPRAHVADPAANLKEVLDLAEEAREQGVQFLVFPELTLTSYTAADLFFHDRALVQAAEDALARLAARTARLDMAIAVGLPMRRDSRLFNCAALIQRGVVRGVVPKSYIPNYNEFYEGRWFSPAREAVSREIAVGSKKAPFGTDLVFRVRDERSLAIGLEICEDLWVPRPPGAALAQAGATVLANLSSSNEGVGKADYRRELVRQQSGRLVCAYVFANTGVHESTTDLVFGGHLMVAENGVTLKENRRFRRTNDIVVTDVDVERLDVERARQKTFSDGTGAAAACRAVELAPIAPPKSGKLVRTIDPRPFVPSDPATLHARCAEILDIQAAGLARRFEHTQAGRLVIGLSGGLDSTLALVVACRACAELGRSRRTILAVTMPGPGTSDKTRAVARRLASAAGVELREIDIQTAIAVHMKDIGLSRRDRSIAFENAQARERTQILFDLANKEGGLVVGTGDLSELAIGFATFGGDHMSMYGVNAGVPKTLVRRLVEYAAHDPAHISERPALLEVLSLPISPELLPSPRGAKEIFQRTEAIVGPYELHDFFLYCFLRLGANPRKILFLAAAAFGKAYDGETLRDWLRVFLTRFFNAQFKRSTLPDGPKVGTVSLSPRGDFRMPSDAVAAAWLQDLD